MADELIEIVQWAKAHNGAALARLVAHYQTPARRVAQNILGNLDDAEDAVQDAWLLALRKLNTLQDPAHFGGWFYRIVANVALRKRQKRTVQGTSLEALEMFIASADEQSLTSEYSDLLPVVMDALSSKEQIVVTLHYFGGVPVAQLAALLDVPQGTIKSRLHHARQLLRKELLNMSTQPNTRPDHIPADFRQTIAGMKGKIEWQAIFNGDFAGWFVEKQP